ncbi:MAG: SET domain-containing protein-lysine N-methyltransferase [Flavobacteriales bacterium]|nr:SET domain-containing protein-lysine N-methyltransferase [Flavobacteriales bacterium]
MNDSLVIDESPIHGKGVFANKNIKQGEVIAECHVLLLHHYEELPEELATLQFPWDDQYYALCISDMGSFFNHTAEANAGVHSQNPATKTQVFAATTDIKKGEEVTIYYNDEFEKFVKGL